MNTKREEKSTLTAQSEKATIFASKFSIPMLVIAVLALGVAVWTLVVTIGIQRDVGNLQPLQVNIGVQDGEGEFLRRRNATQDEIVLVQVTFANTSSTRMSTIAGRISLPNGLEFVSGTATLYNRTNPDGMPLGDSIFNSWVNLGGYGVLDDEGRGTGSVSFQVRVSSNNTLFVQGVNTFNISASVGGYIDGVLATNPQTAYAAVDVIFP